MSCPSVRMKFICRLGYGDSLPRGEEFAGDVPVFGSNGQYATTSVRNTHVPAIVLGRKGSYGKVNWAPDGCFASDTTFFVDERLTVENLRWLYWTLQTLDLDEGSQEAAVPGLNRGSVYEERVYLPSRAKQATIADYLDRETARIDGLIAEKERMLALREEKRAALISCVVTRGLDPNALLKPSGQEWLGEIPAHWRVERAKNLFTVRDERSEDGSEELLTVSHITGVTSRSEKDVYMFEADDKAGYKRCMPGDLAINTLWAWMGAMGVSPLAGIVSPDYHVYTSKGELLTNYVDLLCRSRPFVAEVSRWSKGVWSSRLRLYPENFLEIRLPVPPHEEQLEIVRTVETDQRKASALRDNLQLSITLAKERRAALITAAVTGQIPLEEMPG